MAIVRRSRSGGGGKKAARGGKTRPGGGGKKAAQGGKTRSGGGGKKAAQGGKTRPGGGGKKAARGGKTRRAPATARASSPAAAPSEEWVRKRLFPQLTRHDGCAALIAVAEHAGAEWDTAADTEIVVVADPAEDVDAAERAPTARTLEPTARVLGALAHVARLRILRFLLTGPATYQSIQKHGALKAGPLYHHINQMRLAGLIMPKRRDLYELTRAGRNAILLALCLRGRLVQDGRRRPLARR